MEPQIRPIRFDVADCIEGIAVSIRQRIERYPQTQFNPSLTGEHSAASLDALAKQIREEAQ
jgi:hypothetical protein